MDPGARGRGLGQALPEALASFLAGADAHRLELRVTGGNERAEALYQQAGFRRTALERPLRQGSLLSNIQMAKEPAR